MAAQWDREQTMRRTVAGLSDEFAGIFGRETIERQVRESLATFDDARIKEYVPIFVNQFARERLRTLARAEGVMTRDQPEVLYVCVHNAGRSQMAAAFTATLGGGRVRVRSAGSDPADSINRTVIVAMEEAGIDLRRELPKPLTDEAVRAADAVITMGCGDACPFYPGKRYEDWEVADPAGQPIESVRRIRDEIRARVERLLAELGVASSNPTHRW